jgi:hypothetical protein
MKTLKIAAMGNSLITSAVSEPAMRDVLDCQLVVVSHDLE